MQLTLLLKQTLVLETMVFLHMSGNKKERNALSIWAFTSDYPRISPN